MHLFALPDVWETVYVRAMSRVFQPEEVESLARAFHVANNKRRGTLPGVHVHDWDGTNCAIKDDICAGVRAVLRSLGHEVAEPPER